MKSLLVFGSISLSILSTVAFAADLPSRRAPPVYVPPPVPVFTWTGAYFGATAGYAFDNKNNLAFSGGPAALAGGAQLKSNGFTGGGTIGYNFSTQSLPVLGAFAGGIAGGGLVFGVEADAAYVDARSAQTLGVATVRSRTEYVGTVRGRLGLAFDRLLVYGTGGFAYGGVRNSATFGAFSGSRDKIQTGYAYGGGVEYALPTSSFLNVFNSSAITVKAEYIRYDLGRESFAVTNGAGAVTARNRVDGNLVRAGLNFKFGAPAVPVVARY